MDYIQEELQRQWEALAGVLLGRSPAGDGGGGDAAGMAAAAAAPEAFAPETFAPETFALELERPRCLPKGTYMPAHLREGVPAEPAEGPRPDGRAEDWWKTEESLWRAEGDLWETAEGPWRGAAPAAPVRAGQQKGGEVLLEALVPPGSPGTGRTAPGRAGPAAGRFSAGSMQERTVTEFFRAEGGGTVEAEPLSRAFQRDARRYDGGFSLY